MLTRRQFRVKVMQSIYALTLSEDDSLEKQKEFLDQSILQTFSLYLLVLDIFREIHKMMQERAAKSTKKYLPQTITVPNKSKFLDNLFLKKISENPELDEALKKRKLKQWYLNEEYIKILIKQMLKSDLFTDYMSKPGQDYKEDRSFIISLFKTIIAPNDKLYDFFEDESITWVDDLPLVNTFIVKQFKQIGENDANGAFLPPLYKSKEDIDFARELLVKTLLNDSTLNKEIDGKTPNWDTERIADIDRILLKMAISELLYFPSIPERVTINEYLEIAKEYSTPKSSIFINGVLDKLSKEYREDGRLKKTGRGLL